MISSLYSSLMIFSFATLVVLLVQFFDYKILAPYTLIIWFLVIFGLLPHFSLFYQWDSYRVSIGVTDQSIVFLSYCYTYFSVLIFSILFKILGTASVDRAIRLTNNKKTISSLLLIFLGTTSLVLLYNYVSKLDSIALFVALSESVSDGKVSRSNMVNAFSGSTRWTFLFTKSVMMFLTQIVFLQYLTFGTYKRFYVFLFFLMFTTFSLIMTSEKGPVTWFFLSLVACYWVFRRRAKVSYKAVALAFLALLIFISYLDYLFMGNTGSQAVFSVLSRVGSGGITPVYFYLKFFPTEIEYLGGASLPNPMGILPFIPFNLTIEVARLALPHLAGSGFVSTMPAIFWGELYANFGPTGVLVGTPIFAAYIYMVFRLASLVQSDIIRIACIVWLVFHFRVLTGAGFSEFVLDFDMWLVLCVALSTNYRWRF